MDLNFYGHSCFRIVKKGFSLITDPYDPSMVGLKLPKLEADIVTVSHDHADHNFLDKVQPPPDRQLFPIAAPGEYEVSGCTIYGFSTFHDDQQGTQRGRNVIYTIELDGVRFLHMGDLGHQLTDDLIEELGAIDILLIPVGGIYTLTGGQAANLTTKIEPRIVIPMHYQLPGLKSDNFSQLTDTQPFISQLGLEPKKLPKLSISTSDMPEELSLIILEPKI